MGLRRIVGGHSVRALAAAALLLIVLAGCGSRAGGRTRSSQPTGPGTVLFHQMLDGGSPLLAVDPDGKNGRIVADAKYDGAISPDGTAIAIVDPDSVKDHTQIELFDPKAKTLKTLATLDGMWLAGSGASFAWDPGGDRFAVIVYQAAEERAPMKRTVHVFATGGGSDRVFDGDAVTMIGWSPDSKQLAYVSADGTIVADLSSGKTRRVTEAARAGAWAPDSQRLALLGSDPRLHIIDTGTSREVASAELPGEGGDVAWAASGNRIAAALFSDRAFSIVAVDTATWKSSTLVSDVTILGQRCLAWSPDGSKLAFSGGLAIGPPPADDPAGVARAGSVFVVAAGGGAPISLVAEHDRVDPTCPVAWSAAKVPGTPGLPTAVGTD